MATVDDLNAPKTCPAYGKPCNHCHKLGHYAKFCRSKTKQNKPVNDIEVDSDVSEHGIDTVQSPTMQENEHATLKITNTSVRLKLDSGAETNILTHHDFLKVIPKRQRNNKLKRSTAKLTAFGGHNIPVLGKCYLRCQYKKVTQILEFHVVESGTSLLGCTNCKSMKIISFHNVNQLNNEASSPGTAKSALTGLTSEQIFGKYAPCFEGIGRISEPYHIKDDDSVTPVVHPPRKVPATLRDRVQAELFDMESKGIIKAVNQPTAWVNSMVVNEKRSGRLRICIDPRDLNKAIRGMTKGRVTNRRVISESYDFGELCSNHAHFS